MRRTAGAALGAAALFLSIVAILVGAPSLFYMGTAVIVTIIAARLQAYLSVQGLEIVRVLPKTVRVGERVTIEAVVRSTKRLRRPLVVLEDQLPKRMGAIDRTPSLPIAPSFDEPIRTEYRFRPTRRGVYRWSGVIVYGSDALGLAVISNTVRTEPTELTVVPTPVPLAVELPMASGFGLAEAGTGTAAGGIEPRGVREYKSGDALRHVHWRSSARSRTLLVKEFEAGSQSVVGVFLQNTTGSDFSNDDTSSLDLMCNHAAYLCRELKMTGAEAAFPQLESHEGRNLDPTRVQTVDRLLAGITATSSDSIGWQVLGAQSGDFGLNVCYVMMTVQDPQLPTIVRQLSGMSVATCVIIYDPLAFLGDKAQPVPDSAANPSFIDLLEAAGARICYGTAFNKPSHGEVSK